MIRMMSAVGVLLAMTATGGLCADMVETKAELVPEPEPQIPVFSWTGFYAGAHAGYDIGLESAVARSRTGTSSYGIRPNGVIGGLHTGYNRALSGGDHHAVVVGVEGDVDGADYQRTATLSGGGLDRSTAGVMSDMKASLRARAGVAAGRVLYYATGGAAFASFDTHYNGMATFGPSAVDSYQRIQAGYTLGGGVEYAFLNYMSVRAEYRYTDYGSFADSLTGAAPGANASVTRRESDNRLQAGFSYKFD